MGQRECTRPIRHAPLLFRAQWVIAARAPAVEVLRREVAEGVVQEGALEEDQEAVEEVERQVDAVVGVLEEEDLGGVEVEAEVVAVEAEEDASLLGLGY